MSESEWSLMAYIKRLNLPEELFEVWMSFAEWNDKDGTPRVPGPRVLINFNISYKFTTYLQETVITVN